MSCWDEGNVVTDYILEILALFIKRQSEKDLQYPNTKPTPMMESLLNLKISSLYHDIMIIYRFFLRL